MKKFLYVQIPWVKKQIDQMRKSNALLQEKWVNENVKKIFLIKERKDEMNRIN